MRLKLAAEKKNSKKIPPKPISVAEQISSGSVPTEVADMAA